MVKQLIGTFATEDETIKAIRIYELGGHQTKNITILTKDKKAESLAKRTRITIKTTTGRSITRQNNPLKKLLSKTADFELDTHDKLVGFGLSDETAEKCMEAVKLGKIAVIADDEQKMGHN